MREPYRLSRTYFYDCLLLDSFPIPGLHIWVGEWRISPERPYLLGKNSPRHRSKISHFLWNGFVENIRNICSIIYCCNKQLFQLVSTFPVPNFSLALLLSWLKFSREICSRNYSIMLARCLWSSFLIFPMFMKLSLMIGCTHIIEVG